MNLKKILNKEAAWYFLTLAGLLILLYMGGNIIIDTYFYVISLNILIFLFSYIVPQFRSFFPCEAILCVEMSFWGSIC